MRITDVKCFCTQCDWTGTVGDCEPDVDGDGSLGCPVCLTVVRIEGEGMNDEAIISQEDEAKLDAIWEEICQTDDERLDELLRGYGIDPDAAKRRIQEMVDKLLAEMKAGNL